MTVVFDAAATNSVSGGTSLSWTHTPVGTPTAVGIFIYTWPITGVSITGVTYGGVNVPLKETSPGASAFGDTLQVLIYGLANPLAGAQTVSISFSGSSFASGASVSVTGSNTTTCFSNSISTASNAATSLSVNCPSATGELVCDILGAQSAVALTPDASQSTIWGPITFGSQQSVGSSKAGAASVTMLWTFPSEFCCLAAASFKLASSTSPLAGPIYSDLGQVVYDSIILS